MRAATFFAAAVVASIFPIPVASAAGTGSSPVQPEEALIVTVDRPSDRAAVIAAARRTGGEARSIDATSVAVRVAGADVVSVSSVDGVNAVRENRVAQRALNESVPWTGAPSLWAEGVVGAGTTVVVVDDGVDKQHDALAGSVVAEACFTDGQCGAGVDMTTTLGSALPCSGCAHGTLVAGTIRSSWSILRGMASGSSLFPIKVFGCSTCGAYEADIVDALNHVADRLPTVPVDAVNLSLAFTGFFSSPCDAHYPELAAAVDRLAAAGVAVIVSAGNDGRSDGLPAPACLRNATAVASSASPGSFSSFSNRGPGTDLSAPGSNITSTAPGGSTMTVSGTSFSSPHVAGAVALLRDLEPGLRVDQIRALLTAPHRTVTDGTSTLPELALDLLHDDLPARSLAPGSLRITGDYQPIVANFSGDARTEILFYAPGGTPDYLWTAADRGGFNSRHRPVGGTYRPVVGDFDGNGYDDILWYAPGSDADYVWWSSGTGAFTSKPLSIGGDYITLVGEFDSMPGDDVMFYAPGVRPDYRWTTGGSRTFESTSHRVDGSYTPIVVDLLSNARDEIVWRRHGRDYLWTHSASGAVTSTAVAAPSGDPTVGDFDGNGKQDIAWASSPVTMWWGGTAGWSSAALAAGAIGSFVAADVDGIGGDELLDVVPGSVADVAWSFSSTRALSTLPAPVDHDGQVLVIDIGTVGRSDLLVYAPGVADLLLTSIGPG